MVWSVIFVNIIEFLQTRKITFSLRTRFPQLENGDRLQEKCRIEEKSKFGSVLIEFRNWYSSNVLKCIERKCKYFYMQSDHSLSIKRKLFQDRILHHGGIFQSRPLGILMHLQTNKNFGKIKQIGQTSNLHLWYCVCGVISKQHIGLIAGLITQFMIITHWSKGLAVKVVDIFWVPKLSTFNFHGRILCYIHRFILRLFLCE